MANAMKGIITLWSGAIVDIPYGWRLCDGNNGTPDLRDKFIVGAGSAYAPGAAGGSSSHNHTFTTDGHTHLLDMGNLMSGADPIILAMQSATDTGTTTTKNHLPPYYALCYIMHI